MKKKEIKICLDEKKGQYKLSKKKIKILEKYEMLEFA